ncbi:phospholipid scramblase 2-like, partial [Hemitrygon akajei]|uniref:phospholipid scramblase 2-like n=1 Tax=Hemitrygon akajei TaxID=2704970 RepID=UPI003BF9F5A5
LQVDKLLIFQKFDATEARFGMQIVNKYEVKNSIGQQIYTAVAKSSKCYRIICGKQRPFKVCVQDTMGTDAMYFKRPFRCSWFCSPCCLEKLEVQAPTGEPIGYVIQKWHACLPKFNIQNKNRDTVLRIRGPFSLYGCCNSFNFKDCMYFEQQTF